MSSAFEGLPKTPNLKLNKPGYDNVADIEALNENADILDEEIQGIKNTFVKSVNGKEPDGGGNVNVEEYKHPNSGVTAGTYRSVTVNAQGHVTDGSNPTLAIADGGTGATTAANARTNLGLGNVATLNTVPIANGGTGATTAAGARNALGLGNTTGALPIANGGTGATTAAAARVNLGINIAAIGASGIPDYSAGINIPHNQNYTIPSNGVVVVDFCNYNSEDYLMINNVYMFKGNTGSYLALEIGQFIVGANDVVKHYHGYSQTADQYALEQAVFYPFRN